MKTRWKHLIAGFAMFVLCISICTTTANATVVWEDDFDDGIPDGWTFFGYESLSSPVKTEGNFSASNFMLTVLDDDINVARHDSTVNIGTWSFDMFVPDDGAGTIYLEFMSNGADHFDLPNSSLICVGAWLEQDRFLVWEMVGTGYHVHKNIILDSLQGWYHINVSRASDGQCLVYFNGTLEANFTSDAVTSSTYLQLWCENVNGAAIDNLVVDATPTALPWDLIVIGSSVTVVVLMIAIVFLRRR